MNTIRSLRVSQLQVNLASNFAGKAWTALMSLAFLLVYVRYLGIEAYGLVGFFATLQATPQRHDPSVAGLSPCPTSMSSLRGSHCRSKASRRAGA